MALMNIDRRKVQRAFKMRGLSIRSDACDELVKFLQHNIDPSERRNALDAILEDIKDREARGGNDGRGQRLTTAVVTKSLLKEVVAERSRNDEDVADEALQLLDSFRTPRLQYDVMRKRFTLLSEAAEEGGRRSLHADAVWKVDMLQQRFALVQQRIMRQDLFRPKLVTSAGGHSLGGGQKTQALTPIESLLGRKGKRNLLGLVTQVEEGRYYLEDLTGRVPIDLASAAVLSDGLVTENGVVLVEGESRDDGVFQVDMIGNPPPENRSDSIKAVGVQNTDIFGAVSSVYELDKMRHEEVHRGDKYVFVTLSDVHLDNAEVMSKLDTLFKGYDDALKSEVGDKSIYVFVLMGNFTSMPITHDCVKQTVGYFDELADKIKKHDNICQYARFVLVPGPDDPGSVGKVLPRPPLPTFFTRGLTKNVPTLRLASNPCRIRFYTKEIVFFRDNIVQKLRRNCLLPPRSVTLPETEDEGATSTAAKHAVQTILDQGHLCPLPLGSYPVYWQYDHTLRLYPMPDALIIGDSTKRFFETYCECDAVNPGSFPVEGGFLVYRPVVNMMNGEVASDVEFSDVTCDT